MKWIEMENNSHVWNHQHPPTRSSMNDGLVFRSSASDCCRPGGPHPKASAAVLHIDVKSGVDTIQRHPAHRSIRGSAGNGWRTMGFFLGDLPSDPSGYVKIAIENGPSIVDFPIEHGDFPVRYVSLPEGIPSGNPIRTYQQLPSGWTSPWWLEKCHFCSGQE